MASVTFTRARMASIARLGPTLGVQACIEQTPGKMSRIILVLINQLNIPWAKAL